MKRRAVFILGAKLKTLARGWRSDCVVGGMETRFQWRKAHSRTAKCEAFHFAPRLFFMFLFFWFHSRFGNSIIIAPEIFHWAHNWAEWTVVKDWSSLSCNSSAVPRWLWRWCEKRFARMRKKLYLCIAFREIHPWWQRSGYSSVRLEYTSGGRGVAGSNPVIPTTQKAW